MKWFSFVGILCIIGFYLVSLSIEEEVNRYLKYILLMVFTILSLNVLSKYNQNKRE